MTGRIHMKRIKVLTWILGVTLAHQSWGNVSLRNGNFFIGYTDIVYSGGFEPKVERIYNSKTAFKGMFGWGWGVEYEVYLTVSADGSVVVHEYGGGSDNRFTPKSFNAQELDAAVNKLGEVASKEGAIGTASQLAAYKTKLKTNATFRNEEWDNFLKQGKIQPRQLPMNTKLYSNRFSYQYVTRVSGGYVRTFDTGREETFNEAGKLTRIADKNKNFIEFKYSKDGHLEKMIDNFNRKMFFSFNNQGLLEKIEGENSKTAEYKYNTQSELTSSRDVDGNSYTYKYDSGGRHNLASIGYSDKTTMDISYYGRDKHENVKSVKDRDGTLSEYDYKEKNNTIGITTSVKGPDGKQVSKSTYEYEIAHHKDGAEWTRKLKTILDGDVTETTYNECCGLPLVIKHGKEETTFAYDTNGHVTEKTTPNDVTKLEYHPKWAKVTKVTRYSKKNKKNVTWSTFDYNESGNLNLAKNSEGKGVRLLDCGNGRISTSIDQNRRQITCKYN